MLQAYLLDDPLRRLTSQQVVLLLTGEPAQGPHQALPPTERPLTSRPPRNPASARNRPPPRSPPRTDLERSNDLPGSGSAAPLLLAAVASSVLSALVCRGSVTRDCHCSRCRCTCHLLRRSLPRSRHTPGHLALPALCQGTMIARPLIPWGAVGHYLSPFDGVATMRQLDVADALNYLYPQPLAFLSVSAPDGTRTRWPSAGSCRPPSSRRSLR